MKISIKSRRVFEKAKKDQTHYI